NLILFFFTFFLINSSYAKSQLHKISYQYTTDYITALYEKLILSQIKRAIPTKNTCIYYIGL
ncbi:TPA: hypothetical protein ACT2ET_002157, partial [Streptococcus suis]